MVDAFLRGFEFGPAYSSQLSELAHEFEPRCFWNDHVASKFEARVVQGKLVLHATYRKFIRLPLYDPATQDPDNSNISLSAAILRSTYIDIDNFNRLGCVHCIWTLPAVIMHTIKYLDCYPPGRARSDPVSCVNCATDLRVRAIPEGDEIRVAVNVWHCFGDRIGMDAMEKAFFERSRWTHQRDLDERMVPTRDLERWYEDGPGQFVLRETEGQRSWLQAWRWHYDRNRDGCIAAMGLTVP